MPHSMPAGIGLSKRVEVCAIWRCLYEMPLAACQIPVCLIAGELLTVTGSLLARLLAERRAHETPGAAHHRAAALLRLPGAPALSPHLCLTAEGALLLPLFWEAYDHTEAERGVREMEEEYREIRVRVSRKEWRMIERYVFDGTSEGTARLEALERVAVEAMLAHIAAHPIEPAEKVTG